MFETLFCQKIAVLRHRTGPLAVERQRYLQHYVDQGAHHGRQRKRTKCVLWIARRLSLEDRRGVSPDRLREIEYRKPSPGATMAQVFVAEWAAQKVLLIYIGSSSITTALRATLSSKAGMPSAL